MRVFVFELAFLLFGLCQGEESYEKILKCQDACTASYPAHTYEESGLLDPCKRGCRFFELIDIDSSSNETCSDACDEIYAYKERDACRAGCEMAVVPSQQYQQELTDYQMSGALLVRQAQMQQLVSHWMFEMLAGFDVFNDWYDSTPFDDDQVDGHSEMIIIDQMPGQMIVRHYQLDTEDLEVPSTAGTAATPLLPYQDSDDDFERCMTVSDYSRAALCLVLFVSAMLLTWLSCGALHSAPRQRVIDQKAVEDLGLSYLNSEKNDEKIFVFGHPPPLYTEMVEKKSLIV